MNFKEGFQTIALRVVVPLAFAISSSACVQHGQHFEVVNNDVDCHECPHGDECYEDPTITLLQEGDVVVATRNVVGSTEVNDDIRVTAQNYRGDDVICWVYKGNVKKIE